MKALIDTYQETLNSTSLNFKRYLFSKISWDERMFGIVGARGIGKTTMLLQYIKENLNIDETLYVSMDDFWFANNSLYDLANNFQKTGGKHLFIDEIHKYPLWSKTLKMLYDAFPKLQIIFTGSSVLDILKGSSDLSRRAIIYNMYGLSFREYLNLFHNINIKKFSLKDILSHKYRNIKLEYPLKYFKDFLKTGYYPFGDDSHFEQRLRQIIVQSLETDIPLYADMNVSTGKKLSQLLAIIADSVPFKPNFSNLAKLISVSKNNIADYCYYIEKVGLISQLREEGKGLNVLGKIEKIYLDNTNLIFAVSNDNPDTGNIRETIFYNQLRVENDIFSSQYSDFTIDDMTFEVGGKRKSKKQIENIPNSFIVKDDIELGYQSTLPLWAFGLNY
ncbi:MAG: AAA family ATPase [Bacteroidales bacterium]|jgi:predicted AAA+ superfamily ATPase|nr:AAA family ATPase [Bacteroidales bacterium]